MPYSKMLVLWCHVVLILALTACGRHESVNSGRLKTNDVVTGDRNKIEAAIEDGDLAAMVRLLDEGLNPDTRLNNGRTPLIHATIQNRLKIAKALIARGANPDLTDRNKKTPLDHARENGNTRAILLLDPIQQAAEREILISAIQKYRYGKVASQLEMGVDPNFSDPASDGETPLTLALRMRAEAPDNRKGTADLVISTLLDWKDLRLEITAIDVNFANQANETPLKKAKILNLTDMVSILESMGATE